MGSAGDLVATAGGVAPHVAGVGLHPELAGGAGVQHILLPPRSFAPVFQR